MLLKNEAKRTGREKERPGKDKQGEDHKKEGKEDRHVKEDVAGGLNVSTWKEQENESGRIRKRKAKRDSGERAWLWAVVATVLERQRCIASDIWGVNLCGAVRYPRLVLRRPSLPPLTVTCLSLLALSLYLFSLSLSLQFSLQQNNYGNQPNRPHNQATPAEGFCAGILAVCCLCCALDAIT